MKSPKFLLIAIFSLAVFQMAAGKELKLGSVTLVLEVGVNGKREIIFEVEVADTDYTRLIGLSEKAELDKDKGLLLDFKSDTKPRMWMRNTRFSIDMLFIDSLGEVKYIYRRAEPFSLEIISPDIIVRYVLEITGGQVDVYGIKVGDKIKFVMK